MRGKILLLLVYTYSNLLTAIYQKENKTMRILKNLIRKLEKRFDWFKSQPRPMWGIFILLTVAGVILWIASFKDIDTIPATTMDYQPLEEQAIAIQQNPQL